MVQDPNAHMMFLKPSPPAASLIDNCMECGYCEAVCPSRWVVRVVGFCQGALQQSAGCAVVVALCNDPAGGPASSSRMAVCCSSGAACCTAWVLQACP